MKKTLIAIGLFASFNVIAAGIVSVPTDSKATYTVLDKSRRGHMAQITTRREGPSGVSYSKRLYDCSDWTFKYLGDGDTVEEMNQSSPNSNMASIVEDSIEYYIGKKACE